MRPLRKPERTKSLALRHKRRENVIFFRFACSLHLLYFAAKTYLLALCLTKLQRGEETRCTRGEFLLKNAIPARVAESVVVNIRVHLSR